MYHSKPKKYLNTFKNITLYQTQLVSDNVCGKFNVCLSELCQTINKETSFKVLKYIDMHQLSTLVSLT